jgi:hypothetical protein
LDLKGKQLFVVHTVEAAMTCAEDNVWHKRLAHASPEYLNKMKQNGLIHDKKCEDCSISMAQKTAVPKHRDRQSTRSLGS